MKVFQGILCFFNPTHGNFMHGVQLHSMVEYYDFNEDLSSIQCQSPTLNGMGYEYLSGLIFSLQQLAFEGGFSKGTWISSIDIRA